MGIAVPTTTNGGNSKYRAQVKKDDGRFIAISGKDYVLSRNEFIASFTPSSGYTGLDDINKLKMKLEEAKKAGDKKAVIQLQLDIEEANEIYKLQVDTYDKYLGKMANKYNDPNLKGLPKNDWCNMVDDINQKTQEIKNKYSNLREKLEYQDIKKTEKSLNSLTPQKQSWFKEILQKICNNVNFKISEPDQEGNRMITIDNAIYKNGKLDHMEEQRVVFDKTLEFVNVEDADTGSFNGLLCNLSREGEGDTIRLEFKRKNDDKDGTHFFLTIKRNKDQKVELEYESDDGVSRLYGTDDKDLQETSYSYSKLTNAYVNMPILEEEFMKKVIVDTGLRLESAALSDIRAI